MSSLLSNFMANGALEIYFHSAPNWLGLHSADPGVSGDLSTEINGGGYSRQSINWTSPSSKTIASTSTQIFHDLPACVVRYIAVWDAGSEGHILIRLLLPTAKIIPAAGQFASQSGDIAFSL